MISQNRTQLMIPKRKREKIIHRPSIIQSRWKRHKIIVLVLLAFSPKSLHSIQLKPQKIFRSGDKTRQIETKFCVVGMERRGEARGGWGAINKTPRRTKKYYKKR